jgi:hypothetical protein
MRFGMRIDFEGSLNNLHKYSDLNLCGTQPVLTQHGKMGIVDFQFENQTENWPKNQWDF